MNSRSPVDSASRKGGLLRGASPLRQQASPASGHVENEACSFEVNLIKKAGIVREIEVTCECGGKLRIACDYTQDVVNTDHRLLKSEKS